ncbi:SDR family NAD(P)-dependent oxidoreductase [Chloroflexota bacterium]
MKLKDKVAIVTGGGRGLGREMALAFAEEGANLVLVDLRKPDADAVAEEVRALTRRALAIQADVRMEKQVIDFVEKTVAEFGKVDILVNNAGGFLGTINTLVEDLSLDKWRVVLDTNLTAAFICSKAVLKYMIKQNSGNIINITSGMGQRGRAGSSAYTAAKHGLEGLTKAMALEFAPFNIQVNALQPGGAVATPAVLNGPRIDAGTLLQPQIIREVAVYLASDDSAGVTGQSFTAKLWNSDREDVRRLLSTKRKVS